MNRDDDAPRAPDPRMIPYWEPPPPRRRAYEEDEFGASADSEASAGAADALVIRPFMLTAGRTQPVQDGLRVETLFLAPPAALSAPLRFEARRIAELCQQPTSLADLAVALQAPLGVTRVLVSDLVVEGVLQVVPQAELSVAMIERIRDHVRAL